MLNEGASLSLKPKSTRYDLVVIGSGPGGHRAAVTAAKLGQKVLIIEKDRMGGACLHLGTIPSKALREAALGSETGATWIHEILSRTHQLIDEERVITEEHFHRNQIEAMIGTGSLVGPNRIRIECRNENFEVDSRYIVIATGTRPRRPSEIPFDEEVIFESDSILRLKTQPKTILVLGAGVIGCEYASIFARMGVKVTLVDSRPELLGTIDREIVEALSKQFEKSGVDLYLGAKFDQLKKCDRRGVKAASVRLTCGDRVEEREFDAVLYCLGRTGNHEQLGLASVGIAPDGRGQIPVNSNYQTAIPNIYAVGDIIGAPALAASSSEQGRLAVLHAFTGEKAEFPDTFPYGIYTIPEISSVGMQEAQLIAKNVKYVVGKAPYRILARGKMVGDEFGFLKLLVHSRTRRIVGVHVIGTSATELVHIGQVAMAFGATVDFFVDNVFNYPTLAEAYKVAALNAENKLGR
ncbi:MAG TPA: Si-specific NAD(P)(+) transhydrogenase [Bdellovibrionales bacterium]|nr:Si-specific NAD(P)(+) transhydrogenase [Bdellovibrionales bacterium]